MGRLTEKLKLLKQDIPTLFRAWRDRRVPIYSKVLSFAALIYLLSPFDLIPDFLVIPGFFDDLAVVSALIMLALRTIPAEVLEDYRGRRTARAGSHAKLSPLLVIAVLVLIACFLVYFLGQ